MAAKNMNKIISNSFESVCFCHIYLLSRGKLSKKEVAELCLQSMVLKKSILNVLVKYDLEIESIAYEIETRAEDKYHVFNLNHQMKKSSISIHLLQTRLEILPVQNDLQQKMDFMSLSINGITGLNVGRTDDWLLLEFPPH